MGDYSPAQGRQRRGHRGISAEQGGDVMRILEGAAAARYVRKLEQRGQKLDALEPQVRRIVQSVKRSGDRALRRYAERWDGLSHMDSLRVSEGELRAALESCSRDVRIALEEAAGSIRDF